MSRIRHRVWLIFWGLLLGMSLAVGFTSFPPTSQAQVLQPALDGAPENAAPEDAAPESGTETATPPINGVPDTADVTFDNLPLFQIAEIKTQPAEERAAIIQTRLDRNLETWISAAELPDVRVEGDNTPILYIGDRPILTVTTQDAIANKIDDPKMLADQWQLLLRDVLQQKRREQEDGYTGRAVVSILGLVVAAIIGHWAAGIIWRQYLGDLLDRLTFAGSDERHTNTFSAVSLFLNLSLAVVRGAIWTVALIYSTRFFLVTQRWSSVIRRSLANSFTAEILPIGDTSFSVTDLLSLLLMLFVVVLVTRSLTNLLRARVLQVTGINRGVQEAVAVIIRYLLLVIGTIMVLQIWGLDLSSLTLLASALGIGIGLGLQNIAKDIGSGLVLVFERPIQVGEFIEFDDHMGVVERIGVRSTEIRTLDQVSIIVPNSRFLDGEVTNWSHRNPLSRIHVPVGVAYKSDPEEVRKILLSVARAQPDVLAAPAPQVFFQTFGDSSLNFDLLVWTRHPSKQPKLKSDLNFAIAAAFHEHNIEIPFPQRDLHFIDGELPVGLNAETQALLAKLLQVSSKPQLPG
ncbi:MAG: mechanosensitive ion channel domain-containing protein [Cyanobacteria bacterium J06626_23]